MNCENFCSLVLLWLVCKQVDSISYPCTHPHTHVCRVALCQRSSQHYLKPLLLNLNLNWCISSTDCKLNCTCIACNIQFGFCGFSSFSTAWKCTCAYACFSVKTFSNCSNTGVCRIVSYNRLEAT